MKNISYGNLLKVVVVLFLFSFFISTTNVSAASRAFTKDSSGNITSVINYDETDTASYLKLRAFCMYRFVFSSEKCVFETDMPIAKKVVSNPTNNAIENSSPNTGSVGSAGQGGSPVSQNGNNKPIGASENSLNKNPTIVYQVIERAVPGPQGPAGKDGRDGKDSSSSSSSGGSGGFLSSVPSGSQWIGFGSDDPNVLKKGQPVEITNATIAGTISGAGLASCNATTSKLLYNGTTKLFECANNAGSLSGVSAGTNISISTSSASATISLADKISISEATTTYFYTSFLNALNAAFGTLFATNLSSTNSTTSNATITNSFATNQSVSNLFIGGTNVTNILSTLASTFYTNTSYSSTTNATTSNANTFNGNTANISNANVNILNTSQVNATGTSYLTTTFASTTNSSTTNSNTVNANTNNSNITNTQNVNATNVYATGTSYLTTINATTTNASTTNTQNLTTTGSSTLASTTVSNVTVTGNFAANTIAGQNSSITNSTSTNFFTSILNALTSTISNLVAGLATIGQLNGGIINATSSINALVSNASTTNASTTNTNIVNATTNNSNTTNSQNINASTIFATSSINGTTINASTTNASTTNSQNLSVSGSSTLASTTVTNITSTGNVAGANLSISGSSTMASTTFTNILGNILAFATAYFQNLNVSGSSTLASTTASNLTVTGSLATNIFNAITSTFTNLISSNATFTNATTTNLNISSVANGWLYGDANGNIKASSSPTVDYITATTSTSTFRGINIMGSIIPDLDNVYSLGSPSKRFKDLYVSSGTVYIDNVGLSNNNGQLVWGGTGILASTTVGSSTLGATTITQATITSATITNISMGLANGYVYRGNSTNYSEATSSLFIANNGFIGIGNTAPTSNLSISQGLLTTGVSQGALAITGTWNNASTIFKGIDLDITNSAANTNSTLLNLAVGGSSIFKVKPDGTVTITGTLGITSTTTMNKALDMSSNKIVNLALPTNTTDAANKAYVDAFAQGILYKSPVITVSTTSIVSSTTGDRYIIGVGSSGTGCSINAIAQNTGIGTWTCETPATGTSVFVDNGIDTTYNFNGSTWVSLGSTVNHANLLGLQGGQAGEYYHVNATQYSNLNSVNSQLSQLLTTGTATQFVNLYLTGGLNISGVNSGATISNATFTNITVMNNASISNATSGNFYSNNASITTLNTNSLFTNLLSALTAAFTNITSTNATLTNATATNLTISGTLTTSQPAAFSSTSTFATTTSASSTVINLSSNNATINNFNTTNSTTTNSSTTNLFATYSSSSNSTTTNFFANNASISAATTSSLFSALLSALTASFTSIFATNAGFTYATITNATLTNATSTNLFSTNASFTNATSTNFNVSGVSGYTSTLKLGLASGTTATSTNNKALSVDAYGNIILTSLASLSDSIPTGNNTINAYYSTTTNSTAGTSGTTINTGSTISTTPVSGRPYGVTTYGNYLYVANNGFDVVSVYDITNKSTPTYLGQFTTACTIGNIAVYGSTMYLTDYTGNTLKVFDLSASSTSPTLVTSVATGAYPLGLAVSTAGYLYVANNAGNSISIFNVASSTNPTLSATFATPSNSPAGVAVNGTALYITHYDQAIVRVLNITAPTAPTNLATYATGANPSGLAVGSGKLFITNFGANTISYYDVLNNVYAPSGLASVSAGGTGPSGVTTVDNYFYVVNNGGNSMTTFTVSSNSTYPLSGVTSLSSTSTLSTYEFSKPLYIKPSVSYSTSYAAVGTQGTTIRDALIVNGAVRARGFTVDTAADLAETFPTEDGNAIPDGTVVAFSDVTKSWKPEAGGKEYIMSTIKVAGVTDRPIGVIATNPGFLLGGTNGSPVAFSGRVPLKVTSQNGLIKKGDRITMSTSTAGFAMKQTEAGNSLGIALSDDDGSGNILILVQTGYSLVDKKTGNDIDDNKTVSISNMLTGNYTLIDVGSAITKLVSDLANQVVTKMVKTEVLCIGNYCINDQQLKQIMDSAGIVGNNSMPSGNSNSSTQTQAPNWSDTSTSTSPSTSSSTEATIDTNTQPTTNAPIVDTATTSSP